MIPSDHFVYFYNEIFKELEKLGPEALDRYYARVADRQAYFTLEAFKRDGLKGMYDYWERIRIEENCQSVNELDEKRGLYQARMLKCPSLTKALESDAGPCRVYCNHCPGWVNRVITQAGYYVCYNLVGREAPQCMYVVTKDRQVAEAKRREWLRDYSPDLISDNFAEVDRLRSASKG